MTLYDEIKSLERRLSALVSYFNEDEQWEPAARAQTAILAVHEIFGGDFDSEQVYPVPNTGGKQ